MAYHAEPLLAPSAEILGAYRAKSIDWDAYAAAYLRELESRGAAAALDRGIFERGAVLLCSEAEPEHCHRRLAAEYLARAWGDIVITHL